MINFEVLKAQKLDEKDFVLTLEKGIIKEFKSKARGINRVVIKEEVLNLSQKLYGSNKNESVAIQKTNQKQMLQLYKLCVKTTKILKREKSENLGKFYVLNLKNKANNNDFMLAGMLHVRFNIRATKRLYESIGIACDYIDKENAINNMCDFKDNHCKKHRDKGVDKITGCCPSFCKIRQDGKPCPIKNLSCKIFMCDYLINEKGYYFSPNTIPVLYQHLTIFERLACFGLLFKTQKITSLRLWGIRLLTACYALVAIIVVLMICLL